MKTAILTALVTLTLAATASAQSLEVDVPDIHSQHDYLQDEPIFDALDAGITSLEVDVYRVDGELLIGNTLENATANGYSLLEYLQTLAALEEPPAIDLIVENKNANHASMVFSGILDLFEENEELDGLCDFLQLDYNANNLITSYLATERPECISFTTSTTTPHANPVVVQHVINWGYNLSTQSGINAAIAGIDTTMVALHGTGKEVHYQQMPASQSERELAWGLLFEAGIDHIAASINATDFANTASFIAAKTSEVEAFLGADLGPEVSRALSLNDHLQTNPLYDAMAAGFDAVEVDVVLTGGELRVASSVGESSSGVTLDSLYLSQLSALGDPSFTLFVDIKSDANTTYSAIATALAAYNEENENEFLNLHIIVTGNVPSSGFISFTSHPDYMDVEGPNLTASFSAPDSALPVIRDSLVNVSRWPGTFEMPVSMRRSLRNFVASVHGTDKQVRLTASPATADQENVWTVLVQERVDWIGTTDLAALSSFLAL